MPTDTERNEFLTEKLGLWVRGQKCELNWIICPHRKSHYEPDPILGGTRIALDTHDIPAPNLLLPENLHLLIGALWKTEHSVDLWPQRKHIRVDSIDIRPIDGDYQRALFDAAYKMVMKEVKT